MIVIVEGVDRVGKTTLINKLNKEIPSMILKDANICSKDYKDKDFKVFSLGKLDTSVCFLEQLSDDMNLILVDRLHLTELAYGIALKRGTEQEKIQELDDRLAEMGAILIYVDPAHPEWSDEQAGEDQTERVEILRGLYNTTKLEKYRTNFEELDEMVRILKNRLGAYNKKLVNLIGMDINKRGHKSNNTIEILNDNSTYFDITTREISETFDINSEFAENFESDVKNRYETTIGSYITEHYYDIFDNMYKAMNQLEEDNVETRRCVMHFDPAHCFQTIQFIIRKNKLNVICNMRSCNYDVNYQHDILICSILADEFKKRYASIFGARLEDIHNITMNVGSLHKFVEESEENASK